eukprot:5013708-Pleurochrysis_carterae.AAC.2
MSASAVNGAFLALARAGAADVVSLNLPLEVSATVIISSGPGPANSTFIRYVYIMRAKVHSVHT